MRCIQYCHSQFLPLLSQLKHKQQLKSAKLLWPSNNQPTRLLQRGNIPSLLVPARTKAMTTLVALDVSSPATSGDLSVFIQMSALLLFMYWIANFVVPDVISKKLQFEKTSEDQKPNDNYPLDKEKASMPISSTPRSQTKKQGFNSTKT